MSAAKPIKDAYPLQWPEGWARTALSARRSASYKVSNGQAVTGVLYELKLLGANMRTVILSSNLQLRMDGMPYAGSSNPSDPGVAVYWIDRKHGQRVMACDKWLNVYHNVRAIGLAVKALRDIDRAGATQILERAFQAFGALPAPADAPVRRPWWEVFGLPEEVVPVLSLAMVEAKYRELAAIHHPDKLHGSAEAMAELNAAREQAQAHFGGAS